MGLRRSRAALAGGTTVSVLAAVIGAALVAGAMFGLVTFPGIPRGTGSPQPAIVLPDRGGGAGRSALARPRTVRIATAPRAAAARPARRTAARAPAARPVPAAGRAPRPVAVVPAPARPAPGRSPAPAVTPPQPPVPVVADAPGTVAGAVRPVSPTAADTVAGAVDTATGAVTQAGGALPPLPPVG